MEDELNTNTNINNNNNNNNILSSNHDLLEMSSENLTNYFLNNHTTTWQQQQQQQQQHNDQSSDPFESALSSMVSSPVATAAPSSSNGGGGNGGAGEAVMIKELIGRLGTICDNSGGDVSPQSCIVTTNNNGNVNNKYTNSGSNSNYSTPLNSPPSGNFNLATLMTNYGNNYGCFPVHQPSLGSLNADPGFVERAAKFSCFGSLYPNYKINDDGLLSSGLEPGKLSRVNSGKKMGENNGDSREGSSVSEQNPGTDTGFKGSVAAQNDGSSRKRKSGVSKAKVKETSIAKDGKVEVENGESNAKRSKVEDEKKENGEQNAEEPNKEASKPEPLKDYIHVRARRGQATDSHSLAERVRREKISERMKFLQDLVPGCNKVTGKATVLDEIINYVQSLQRQVEFLSMKLSTVNPRMEFNMEALFSKDMLQSRGSTMQQAMYQVDQNSAQAFPYGYQTTQQMSLPSPNGAPNRNEHCFSGNPMNGTAIRRNPGIPLPLIDGFLDPMTQMSNLWEDDLQSVVQMGINQNQSQNVPAGSIPNAQMKVEL